MTNVFSVSFVQLVSGAGNENGFAAERGKLGGAGSVRDPCGFGPDKARRHVSGCSWHAPYRSQPARQKSRCSARPSGAPAASRRRSAVTNGAATEEGNRKVRRGALGPAPNDGLRMWPDRGPGVPRLGPHFPCDIVRTAVGTRKCCATAAIQENSMAFLRYSEATVDPNRLSLWPDVLAP